jgi:hypothetical protein
VVDDACLSAMILIVVAGSWTRKVTTNVHLGWDNLVFHVTGGVIGSPTISFRVSMTDKCHPLFEQSFYLHVNVCFLHVCGFAATQEIAVLSLPLI